MINILNLVLTRGPQSTKTERGHMGPDRIEAAFLNSVGGLGRTSGQQKTLPAYTRILCSVRLLAIKHPLSGALFKNEPVKKAPVRCLGLLARRIGDVRFIRKNLSKIRGSKNKVKRNKA